MPETANSCGENETMDSTPSRRFSQNSSTFLAPGNRPLIPMMAMSSRLTLFRLFVDIFIPFSHNGGCASVADISHFGVLSSPHKEIRRVQFSTREQSSEVGFARNTDNCGGDVLLASSAGFFQQLRQPGDRWIFKEHTQGQIDVECLSHP